MLALAGPPTSEHSSPRSFALAFRRRCGICGCLVPEGQFWQVFHGQSDVLHHPGVTTVPKIGAIFHKACAAYATLVCPFLKYPTSRSNNVDMRGNAEMLRFRHYGIAFYGPRTAPPYTHATPWNNDDAWAYLDRVETIKLRTWRDLLPMYDEMVAAENIDTSTRLYWTDSDSDHRRLDRMAQQDNAQLARLRATAPTQVGGYRLALL